MHSQVGPQRALRARGAETAEQIGDALRVSGDAEERCDPRGAKRGKEILQIHAKNHAATHVRSNERSNGTATQESVGGRMRWNLIQDVKENLALDVFEVAHTTRGCL